MGPLLSGLQLLRSLWLLGPTQHLHLWDLCDFTAIEIKCSFKWHKSLSLLASALPEGKLLGPLGWGLGHPPGSPFPQRGSLHALLPTKLATLIFEARRTLSSKQLTGAPESKYIYLFIQEVISLLQALSRASPKGLGGSPRDYSLTVADPGLWALE